MARPVADVVRIQILRDRLDKKPNVSIMRIFFFSSSVNASEDDSKRFSAPRIPTHPATDESPRKNEKGFEYIIPANKKTSPYKPRTIDIIAKGNRIAYLMEVRTTSLFNTFSMFIILRLVNQKLKVN